MLLKTPFWFTCSNTDWAPKISSPEEKEHYSLWDSSASDIYHEAITENTDYKPCAFLICPRLPNYFLIKTNGHLCFEVAAELEKKEFIIHHLRYHCYQEIKISYLSLLKWLSMSWTSLPTEKYRKMEFNSPHFKCLNLIYFLRTLRRKRQIGTSVAPLSHTKLDRASSLSVGGNCEILMLNLMRERRLWWWDLREVSQEIDMKRKWGKQETRVNLKNEWN